MRALSRRPCQPSRPSAPPPRSRPHASPPCRRAPLPCELTPRRALPGPFAGVRAFWGRAQLEGSAALLHWAHATPGVSAALGRHGLPLDAEWTLAHALEAAAELEEEAEDNDAGLLGQRRVQPPAPPSAREVDSAARLLHVARRARLLLTSATVDGAAGAGAGGAEDGSARGSAGAEAAQTISLLVRMAAALDRTWAQLAAEWAEQAEQATARGRGAGEGRAAAGGAPHSAAAVRQAALLECIGALRRGWVGGYGGAMERKGVDALIAARALEPLVPFRAHERHPLADAQRALCRELLIPWLLQPSAQAEHSARPPSAAPSAGGDAERRALALGLPAHYVRLVAAQHETLAAAAASGSGSVHVAPAYAEERAQRLALLRALLRLAGAEGSRAHAELADAGLAGHVVRTMLGSRDLVQVSGRVPVPFLAHNNSLLLREEGIDLLAEAVAARHAAPTVYAAFLAHIRCDAATAGYALTARARARPRDSDAAGSALTAVLSRAVPCALPPRARRHDQLILNESSRLTRPADDTRLLTGALRLLRVLVLAEDEALFELMRAAGTAEHVFRLYSAAATPNAAGDAAHARVLHGNAQQGARARGAPPAKPSHTREQLVLGIGARAFMEVLWGFERRTLLAHPLLSDAMRAAAMQQQH